MSYLFLPFEFCDHPTKPTQKKIDTSAKEIAKSGVYNAELLFWTTCFTPYLLKASGSRKIQPQPREVREAHDAA